MLNELKNYLDITWNDEGTDSKLAGILERAKDIMNSYAGTSLSFEDQSDKQLLFDCCRYIRSNALEDFKSNFSAELIMLRAKYAVASMEGSDNEEG